MKTISACVVALLALLNGTDSITLAGEQAPEIRRFAFGPPGSALRPGFTKVTIQDAFTAEKGYGFDSTKGLLAFDRGGSETNVFETAKLKPGIYTLQAAPGSLDQTEPKAKCQVLVVPHVFEPWIK